jgi:hypothetical protein
VLLRQPGQYQLGFAAAPLEFDDGCQLDRVVAWLPRYPKRVTSAQQRASLHFDNDPLLVDDDLLDELSDDPGSFGRLSLERCRETGRTGKQSANLIAGHVRSAERIE